MLTKIAIVYNDPVASRYSEMGEGKAIAGVLDEVKAAHKALTELGYSPVRLPLQPPLSVARDKIRALGVDLVFNLFEGFDGCPETEAIVAGYVEEAGIKHTGCPSSALALALDKPRARSLLAGAGVLTPRYQVLSPERLAEFNLPFPVIVKPANEHASHGISKDSVVNDMAALECQVKWTSERYGGKVMVEEFLDGREFNATVMGDTRLRVLPPSEIVYSLPPGLPRLLTFAAKWEPTDPYYGATVPVCPAKIDDALRKEIERVCLASFEALGCRSYGRVDMRLNSAGQVVVLEVNPNPDISPQYGAARQARAAGMTYVEFIRQIIHFAREGDAVAVSTIS